MVRFGRIYVAGTADLMMAAVLAKGETVLENAARERQAGVEIAFPAPGSIQVKATGPLRAVDIVTAEHPGFPTDMQAQWMAMMTQAAGESSVVETIFENRFMHAPELLRMGADITLDGNRAVVRGKTVLTGADFLDQLVLRDAHRLQEFLQQDFTGVRVGNFAHEVLSFSGTPRSQHPPDLPPPTRSTRGTGR